MANDTPAIECSYTVTDAMNYCYKVTTHGRAVMAACMALEQPMRITRVAFGSGKIEPEVNPADVHELLSFVSNGTVAERRHEADRLFLTIRYANQEHQDVKKMFLLSEFMIYVEDPESGAETDLMYGTLGDYRQPVPAYTPAFSPSIFSFPLVLVISDDVHVEVDVPVGIATYYDLEVMAKEFAIRSAEITIPASGWTADTQGRYRYHRDVAVEEVTPRMVPEVTVLPAGEETAVSCGLAPFAQTLEGVVRLWAVTPPGAAIPASLTLLRDSSGVIFSYENSGSVGELPIATETTPGAVMPGPGLTVGADGTLSLDTVSDDEFRALLDGKEGE